MKKAYYISALLLIVLSCTKFGKNVTVKGRVLNPITGEGIPDVKLNLRRGTVASFNGGYKTVKSTTTDANGYFEINKLGLSSYDIQADISTDLYGLGWYKDGEKTGFTSIEVKVKKGKTLNVDYHAVEYGTHNVNIENQNCEGSSDLMNFRFKTQFDDDFGYQSLNYNGCYSSFSLQQANVPMGTRIYEMTVSRPSGTLIIYDTVFVPSNGNVTVNLFY